MRVLTKNPIAFEQWQSSMNYDDLFAVGGAYTTLAADSGSSVAAQNEDNGVALMTTGATNNNECAIYTASKIFTFADKRSIFAEALIKYTEAATNAANIAFGFHSAFGADVLTDDGAGLAASFSGALIYKVDGGTVWKATSSLGAVQTTSTIAQPSGWANAVPGVSNYVRLGVLFAAVEDPANDYGEISYYIDGREVYDNADLSRNKPLKHRITYTSAAAMALGVYLKAGTGTSQTARVDSIAFSQTRTYNA